MNKSLQKIFDALEYEKQKLLTEISDSSEEKLNQKGQPDKWSINQILTHVIEAERFSIKYMQKKSMGIDSLNNSGLKETFKSAILTMSQRISFLKYKALKAIPDPSAERTSISEIEERWSNVRLEMKVMLDSIDEKNIRKKIYKHPVAGYLNAKQGVGFLNEHLLHHLPQIKRLLK